MDTPFCIVYVCNGLYERLFEWKESGKSKQMTREEIIEELKYLIEKLEFETSEVHAHWIKQEREIFKCSNCGNYLDFRGVNAGRGDANYCPNCGAKMEEEENE